MKTNIFVVTHKDFDQSILSNKGDYKIIKVGNKIADEEAKLKQWFSDSTGDSISDENAYYCELTAYYWIWKNVHNVDITGVNHYRRYFFNYKSDSKRITDDIICTDEIERIMKNKKAIMSFYSIKQTGINYFKKNQKIVDDWAIIEKIILNDYPEMKSAFYKCIHSRLTVYGNMIIAYKNDFDKYCEWLFDVLRKYDMEKTARGEERRLRVDGYISENLLWIWSQYYYKKSEVYRLEIRNTEDDNLGFVEYGGSCKGKILHTIKKNRFLLVIYRYVSLLYLLINR